MTQLQQMNYPRHTLTDIYLYANVVMLVGVLSWCEVQGVKFFLC